MARSAPPVLRDFGAHVSIAGGLEHSFARGDELGARAVQIFCKNQRQWKARPLGDYEVGRFRRHWRESKVERVVAHATYLINLASDDETIRAKSIACLGQELQTAAALRLDAVVVHPGSCPAGPEEGIERIARALEELDQVPDYAGSTLALESTAGQGHAIGWRLEHLEAIVRALAPNTAERVGVCLDTCHLHAAGYDVSSAGAWTALLDEFEARLGLARLVAIHVNDSKTDRGSRVDRHANLGAGTIGLDGFRALVHEPRLLGIPKLLETPDEDGGHAADLATLADLARG